MSGGLGIGVDSLREDKIREINQILRANAWLRDELIQSGWFEEHRDMVINEQNIGHDAPIGGFVLMNLEQTTERLRQLEEAQNNYLLELQHTHLQTVLPSRGQEQEESKEAWNQLIQNLNIRYQDLTREANEHPQPDDDSRSRAVLTMIEIITGLRDTNVEYRSKPTDDNNIIIHLNILRFLYKFPFIDLTYPVNRIYFCRYQAHRFADIDNHFLFRQENGEFARYVSGVDVPPSVQSIGMGNNTGFPLINGVSLIPGNFVELECNITANGNGLDILYILMTKFNEQSNIKYTDLENFLLDFAQFDGNKMHRIFWDMKYPNPPMQWVVQGENPDLGGGRGKKITLTKKRKNRVYVVGEKNMKGTRKNRKNKKRTKNNKNITRKK